jgi:hypothetical protein
MNHILLLRIVVAAAVMTALSGCCCEGAGDIADIAGGGFKFYQEISTAPGASQVKATGCDQAFVITPEALNKFLASVEKVAEKNADKNGEETAEKPKPPELKQAMVMCQVQKTKKAPTCDKVAKAYAGAVEDTTPFGVLVQSSEKRDGPVCDGLYKADGSKIGELPKGKDGNVDTSFMPDK